MKKLGLDLGTNSLGWSIIEDQKIIDAGVVIFEQGIPLDQGKEAATSPAADRRGFRAMRRLKFRRRLRKYHTLKILIENGMCPLSLDELQAWIRKGVFPVMNQEFIQWLNSTLEKNPYAYRANAVRVTLAPMEVGRAFYHLALRRGFKSSRKDAAQEEENDKNLSEFKQGIRKVTEELKKHGDCTVGEFFYELLKQGKKVRRDWRVGRVEHYEPEFRTICAVQKIPADVEKKLYQAIFSQRPLRSQKHLVGNCTLETKRPRCMTGHPFFERYRMLAFINSIKITQDGENSRFLNDEERKKIQNAFFVKEPSFKFEKIIKNLYPKYKKDGSARYFNYNPDKTVSSCPVTHQLQKVLDTDDLFSWNRTYTGRDGRERVMDYQTLFDALTYFDDESRLEVFASERAGLSPEKTKEFLKIRIPEGYAQFSLYAMRKIMPFLEKGHIQTRAVALAKLPDLIGRETFEENAERIISDIAEIETDYRRERDSDMTPRERAVFLPLTARLRDYFESTWQMAPGKFDLLYQYNDRSDYPDCSEKGILPPVNLGMIYNPMVHRSLTILRRLVNHLRKKGKIDRDTEIHIELARSVNDKNTRLAYEAWQKDREILRNNCAGKIREHGMEPTEDLIRRYILWQEQQEHCLYTGRKIGWADLLNSTDIEHTIPRSRGGDNSLENLTLCFAEYNRNVKVGRLPSECLNYGSAAGDYEIPILKNLEIAGWFETLTHLEKNYESAKSAARAKTQQEARAAARQKALKYRFELEYWREKIKAFKMTAEDLDGGFSKRQLVDTGVMSRHAVFLLKSVYAKVYSRSGKVTAYAREAWGVQNIDTAKDRSSHVHHAIDAMVLAALSEQVYKQITTAFRNDEEIMHAHARKSNANPAAYPWQTFPYDVQKTAEQILIRHLSRHNETKQTHWNAVILANPLKLADGSTVRKVKATGDSVRGRLHEDTYYGRIKDPADGQEKCVVRKFLNPDSFKSIADLEHIVDKHVRQAVIKQIQQRMDEGKTFKDAFAEEIRTRSADGGFHGPPVKRVRVFARLSDPLKIRKQQYASEKDYKNYIYANTAKGGNFITALYRDAQNSLNFELLTLWEWANGHKNPDFVPLDKRIEKGTFIGCIQPGNLVLTYEHTPDELKSLSPEDLKKRLYKISKFESDGRLTLVYHQDARAQEDIVSDMKKSFGKKTSNEISCTTPYPLLRIGKKTISSHLIFEGIDFNLSIDGEITFIDK